MKFAASILAAGLLAAACSTGSPPVVSITHVSTARVIGPAMDGLDQPSFAFRTGRPPALSLQELFHPRYNVPADPSLVRTLLVTGDIIPAPATSSRPGASPGRPSTCITTSCGPSVPPRTTRKTPT